MKPPRAPGQRGTPGVVRAVCIRQPYVELILRRTTKVEYKIGCYEHSRDRLPVREPPACRQRGSVEYGEGGAAANGRHRLNGRHRRLCEASRGRVRVHPRPAQAPGARATASEPAPAGLLAATIPLEDLRAGGGRDAQSDAHFFGFLGGFSFLSLGPDPELGVRVALEPIADSLGLQHTRSTRGSCRWRSPGRSSGRCQGI
jgi:hypothetical protein